MRKRTTTNFVPDVPTIFPATNEEVENKRSRQPKEQKQHYVKNSTRGNLQHMFFREVKIPYEIGYYIENFLILDPFRKKSPVEHGAGPVI